jgi:hypothetical protein
VFDILNSENIIDINTVIHDLPNPNTTLKQQEVKQETSKSEENLTNIFKYENESISENLYKIIKTEKLFLQGTFIGVKHRVY